jgi:leucyl aminopeptidase
MTDFASLLVPDRGQTAGTIHLADQASAENWIRQRPARDRAMIAAQRFNGAKVGHFALLPTDTDRVEVVAAVKDRQHLTPWCLARLAEALPEGSYRLEEGDLGPAALGWLLAQHRRDAFRSVDNSPPAGPRILVSSEPARIDAAVQLAKATALVRDLVDRPANALGPAELEDAVREQALDWGAEVRVVAGEALREGFPLIHAVGAAAGAGRAPRLIEVEWGNPANPRVAVVGKGVCFDSGGLDIKPATGMRLMKKDMGGAAHALALAGLIVSARLPVRLHLLIAAVENSISGEALRPGDIVRSRQA